MTIRILCIVIAFIVAVWVNREVNLSGGWTVIFTLLASAAVGFMAGDGRFISKVLMTVTGMIGSVQIYSRTAA